MNNPNPNPPPEQKPDNPQSSGNAGILTILLHHSITVLILVLVLALGVWGYLNFRDAQFFTAVDREQFEQSLQPSLVEAQHQRLSAAIEVYALAYERYPTHLREVTEAELLAADDLYYPAGIDAWSYELHGDGFRLRHRASTGESDDDSEEPAEDPDET